MTKNTRRLIFYILVIVFIITTPLTIMYAMGYSYDWQKGVIVQTGGIYLKSTPSGAQILINGRSAGKTDRLIPRLNPHDYSVSVLKENFHPWQKTLEVSPNIVIEARNIFLFPQQLSPELIAQNSTSTLEDFLKTDREKENHQRAQLIASSSAGWLLNNADIFFISENNFELYQKNLSGTNLAQLSKEPLAPDKYQIITNDQREFFILSNSGKLYLLNKDGGLFENIANEVKNVRASTDNKKILYFNDNEIWIYYLQDILIQPYKTAGEKELITRYAQKITQAIFYPNNEYIAFIVNNHIKVIELDGRDKRNTIDFIQASDPQIYFDHQSNYFYYLSEGSIFKLKL